jgi:SAM-dependent methyltransferase
MASDWRLVAEPLGKRACQQCGLIARPLTPAIRHLFDSYELYAHAPGPGHEAVRQGRYAQWIAAHLDRPPALVFDAGCGNGSLLCALAAVWPGAALEGCDRSGASVAHGAAAGLSVWQGSPASRAASAAPDLVVSVNVIEHTPDPAAFVRELSDVLGEGGTLVLICPDGSNPSVELLVADHLSSFTSTHLTGLVARPGLTATGTDQAPPELGAFQMVVARKGTSTAAGTTPVLSGATVEPDVSSRVAAASAFLERWRALDGQLAPRVPDGSVCFGVGETAGLLRAYAPRTWTAVCACTSDDATEALFGITPVVPLDFVPATTPILLAVRPADQPRVAARLAGRFPRVISWYDVTDAR